MIERKFYVDTRFDNFARLIESFTLRYPKPDIFRFGDHTYLTLKGACRDNRSGRIVIGGVVITEDKAGNIIRPPTEVEVIAFEVVAAREDRLKVTARCSYEDVMSKRFKELLDEVRNSYPEANISPVGVDDREREMLALSIVHQLKQARQQESQSQYEGAFAREAESCGLTLAEARQMLLLYESGNLAGWVTEHTQSEDVDMQPDDISAPLAMARRALAHLEEQLAGFGALHAPAHLKIEVEEKRRRVAELEARLGGATGAPSPARHSERSEESRIFDQRGQQVGTQINVAGDYIAVQGDGNVVGDDDTVAVGKGADPAGPHELE